MKLGLYSVVLSTVAGMSCRVDKDDCLGLGQLLLYIQSANSFTLDL